MISAPLYSFDVFDTVLTRQVLYPKDVFHLVQRRIPGRFPAIARLGKSFWGERVWAEFLARRKAPGEDVTLAAIYQSLAMSFGLDECQRDLLMALELEVESEVLIPVAGAVSLMNSCRRNDAGIIFVSDMYLPAAFIESIMTQTGLFLPGDRLYVSGELGRTKGSGSLFRYLLEDLGLEPGQLVHCGDHAHSDFLVPRSLGIGQMDETVDLNGRCALWSGFRPKLTYLRELLQARRRISEAYHV